MKQLSVTQNVFGVQFSPYRLSEVADIIVGAPADETMRLVVTANVDHVINLHRLPEFRQAYAAAAITTIDGAPVMLYAHLRGLDVPERVTGADLLPVVLDRLEPGQHRPFFVAANRQTAERLVRDLLDRGFDPADIAWAVPPFGFEQDAAYSATLLADIARAETTHLFLGVGSPKSELWVYRHRDALAGISVLCVGAALEFQAGNVRRAPPILRTIGMEWAWRFISEPRRLWRRYVFGLFRFLSAIGADLSGRWPSDAR